MKKVFLLGLFCTYSLLVPTSCLHAQASPEVYKEEALAATRQLATHISLDDARQLPVRRLTQSRLAQEAEMRRLYANDPAMLQNKLRALGEEYTTQLSSVLTAAQFQRYLAAAPGTLPVATAAMRAPEPIVAPRPTLPKKSALAREKVNVAHQIITPTKLKHSAVKVTLAKVIRPTKPISLVRARPLPARARVSKPTPALAAQKLKVLKTKPGTLPRPAFHPARFVYAKPTKPAYPKHLAFKKPVLGKIATAKVVSNTKPRITATHPAAPKSVSARL